MGNKKQTSFDSLKFLNVLFIFVSVVICSFLMLLHIPGMELLGTNPNWLLIWVVAWSIKRNIWQGVIAGLIMGCIYDGIVISTPSYILSFVLVGVLTSCLQKQKYIGEDFISVAFIVFFMTILAETVYGLQYARYHFFTISEIIDKYQQIAIISAIINSLWSPAFYYPFDLWNNRMTKTGKQAIAK